MMFRLRFNVILNAWPIKHGNAEFGVHKKVKKFLHRPEQAIKGSRKLRNPDFKTVLR
jgi:hypothetical protein